jgi:glucosamine--fructose-6-phosphate aminotransferase (isomerizing)
VSELGSQLEAEIREQPGVWRRLARTTQACAFAEELDDRDVVLVGSGSSLCVAMLGALALRRRGIRAAALAATEANFERGAYCGQTVVALSQSGRSADVLRAVEVLQPERLIVLTNDPAAPLAARAHLVIDIDAGRERAVPATKTVSAMVAIVLWGAALVGGDTNRSASSLLQTADDVESWLGSDGVESVAGAARAIAGRSGVAVVGAGYGVPIALELALKLKEASYLHAEGFAAGEFRHGSAAILDATTTLIGIVDDPSREIVRRPLEEAERTESLRFTIGESIEGVAQLGARTGEAFNTLAWLVAGQLLALESGRARGIDGDAPRGLTKFVT